MEHSYSRDWRPMEGAHVMTTRTIMVHRPPPCPSCHVHSHDDIGVDMGEQYNPPIPSYNEDAAKTAMEECERVASTVRTTSLDDEDWEEGINKLGWSKQQDTLFTTVAHILDLDHMARLANKDRQHEPVLRRVVIDKSVSRVRKALAKISWEPRLTQWLHGLLMDTLPPSYMASYLDMLQTLKTKIPTLVDKMMFGRPISVNQDILGPVLKRAWEPCVAHKNRKLPGQAIIVIVPSSPVMAAPSSRLQRWYSLFATMANVVPIQMNISGTVMEKQSLQCITEQMIAISRAKIQEIRAEVPNRQIILVGFNAGAALALQIALVETVNSIVCMGFAYNTLNGVRGAPDDRILDITTPVLFALGQNSARSSQEEIESLREKMQAQTSLVVVGSADDALRVGKTKRQIEGVTQTMVDNMIMDEISEFASTCIINPPAPRDLAAENLTSKVPNGAASNRQGTATVSTIMGKKRKNSEGSDMTALAPKNKIARLQAQDGHAKSTTVPRKVGRPRIHPPTSPKQPTPVKTPLIQQPTTEALNMAIQSILPSTPATTTPVSQTVVKDSQPVEIISSYEVLPNMDLRPISQSSVTITSSGGGGLTMPGTGNKLIQPIQQRPLSKVKVLPPNQFVRLKPPGVNTQKVYTLKTTPKIQPPIYTVRNQVPSTSTSIVDTRAKVFTVKSSPTGTQLLSAVQPPPPINKTLVSVSSTAQKTTGPLVISPKKYTIMKPPAQPQPTLIKITPASTANVTKATPDLSGTNIFDIPIVFADNDGNIQDNSPITSTPQPTTHHGTVVLSSQQMQSTSNQLQGRNIFINSVSKPTNKMLIINRGPLKGQQVQVTGVSNALSNVTVVSTPSSSTTSAPVPALVKYTKVNVSNASSINLPIRTGGIDVRAIPTTNFKSTSFAVGSKVEILNNSIIKSSSSSLPNSITLASNVTAPPPPKAYQPIVINVDSDKTTIKNMIKVGDTQVKPNTILIKPGSLKPIPLLKPTILNRNITVRKVVNLVTQKPALASVTNAGHSIPKSE